uniref:Uncharacterized protein n=1 Tax=Thermofilum pendens TaxID=2269 RepID=A0A7J3X5V1_THEPE
MRKTALLVLIPLALAVFYIVSNAQPPTLPIVIEAAQTLNETGGVDGVFKRGELVLVEATLSFPATYYAPPSLEFLYIVKFQDSRGVTFYYGVVKTSLEQGKTGTYTVGGKIPENAPTGTYTAWIYVWSNWPIYGFTAYAVPREVTFTVTP